MYNTSKEVKIRWLAQAKDVKKKKNKKSRKGAQAVDSGDSANENEYKLSYADLIEPTSIVMQVIIVITAGMKQGCLLYFLFIIIVFLCM